MTAESDRSAESLLSLPAALAEGSRAFLQVLAHELRNHLAPIRNAAYLIRLRGGSDAELAPLLDVIERQVAYIVRALEVVVDAERVNRGDIVMESQEVDLVVEIAAAIDRARPTIESRTQRLHVSLPRESVWVRADPARLAQILDTVIDNATRYTGADGDIRLELLISPKEAELRVRDSGSGIAADFLPHVFDYFAGHNQPVHGLGVGLAVAQRLLEMQGGRIGAASAGEGKGSEFAIHLRIVPRNENEEEGGEYANATPVPATSASASAARRPGGRRILIADDSEAVRDSLASLLEDMGHEVRGAQDGEAALELAKIWQPDLVLLDIHMPKLNGFRVARELRARFPAAPMQLVMMSGITLDEATLAGAKSAGFDACVDKVSAFSELQKHLGPAIHRPPEAR